MQKPKKPVGIMGEVRVEHGADPEFLVLKYPDTKAELERFILCGTLRAAREAALDPYGLTADPVQNDENGFDFTLPTASGTEYLDLAEIAFLKGTKGYQGGPVSYVVGDFAEEVVGLIKKKAQKYGLSRRASVHLLLYITDWRFALSESAVTLVRLLATRRRHSFRSILYYVPVSDDRGLVWQLFPNPMSRDEVAQADEHDLRRRVLHQGDPRTTRLAPDGEGATLDFPGMM